MMYKLNDFLKSIGFLYLLHLLKKEFSQWGYTIIFSMPGAIDSLSRSGYLKLLSNSCGKKVRLSRGVEIVGLKNISFGNGIRVSRNAGLYSNNATITIGNNVGISINSASMHQMVDELILVMM